MICGDFNLEYDSDLHARLVAPFGDGTPALSNAWDLWRPGQPYPATFCIHNVMPGYGQLHCDFFLVDPEAGRAHRRTGRSTRTRRPPITSRSSSRCADRAAPRRRAVESALARPALSPGRGSHALLPPRNADAETMTAQAFAAWAAAGRPAVAFIVHGWGGGVRRHVDDLAALLAPDVGVVFVEPAGRRRRPRCACRASTAPRASRCPASFPRSPRALAALGVARLHYHHVHGMPQAILDLPRASGLAYDVTLHDYFAICPQLHLVGPDGRYCGEPGEAGCAACIAVRPAALAARHRRLALRVRDAAARGRSA